MGTPLARSPAPRSPAPFAGPLASRDFSFLLRPEIFHQLSPLSVPAPFRNPSKQPAQETPISELLNKGHFRAAAIAAVQALTSSPVSATAAAAHPPVDPNDHARIFELLYVRLACLCLIDATPLAAQEVKALEDLNSNFYLDPVTGAHLVPWELRVLGVRLQAIGFGDPRRAVMSYYELAREARAHITKATAAHDHSAAESWKRRLAEMGVKVAGVLIEMDDLAGAAEHLATLEDGDQPYQIGGDWTLPMSRALLWLHLGDVEAARRSVRDGKGGETGEQIVDALADMADGEYGSALEKWKALKAGMDEKGVHDEMVGVNLAVCLLYTGNMTEVSTCILSLLYPTLIIMAIRRGNRWKVLSMLVNRHIRFYSTSQLCTSFAPTDTRISRLNWRSGFLPSRQRRRGGRRRMRILSCNSNNAWRILCDADRFWFGATRCVNRDWFYF